MTTTQQPLTITITENGAKHVQQFMAAEGIDQGVLRVAVKGGGCSGLTYVLDSRTRRRKATRSSSRTASRSPWTGRATSSSPERNWTTPAA